MAASRGTRCANSRNRPSMCDIKGCWSQKVGRPCWPSGPGGMDLPIGFFTAQSVDAGSSWSTPALRWTSPGGIQSLEASGSDSLSVAAIAIASLPDDQIHLLLGDATSGIWKPSLAASAKDDYASTPVVAVSPDGGRVVAGWSQPSDQQLEQGKFISSFDGGSTWTEPAEVRGFYPATSIFPARTAQLVTTASGATLAWACQCPMNNIVRASRALVRIEVFTNGFELQAPARSGH